MPRNRVEVLREVFSEWAKGNFGASVDLLAADAVAIWGEPPGADVVCNGPREIAERFREFLASWREFRVEADEFIVLDADHIMVIARQHGQGTFSGAATEMQVHIVWKFAEEKIVGTYWYIDRAKALRIAGLSH